MSCKIFISYSREDKELVSPIVQLLRTALHKLTGSKEDYWDLVFQDVDNIRPGEIWKSKIIQAIIAVQKVFVFWCAHAEKSAEVKYEYELALRIKKEVTPILIDHTPLSPSLKHINGIDLRSAARHQIGGTDFSSPAEFKSAETILKEFSKVFSVDAEKLVTNYVRNEPHIKGLSFDKKLIFENHFDEFKLPKLDEVKLSRIELNNQLSSTDLGISKPGSSDFDIDIDGGSLK